MLFLNSGKLGALTGAIVSMGLAAPSSAQEIQDISGDVVMELQNEYTAKSDDPTTNKHNNLFFRTEVAPTLRLTDNIFIDGVAVWENIQNRDPDEHNTFDNEGLFIEEIKLNYENGAWAAWAGKFNPGFGIAWDYGRGIWGEDFAEDYEITEKIGIGASYTLGTETLGTHTLTASTFFADTTFLSGSISTKRDVLDRDDNAVSNTQDFSSFVISLDGENLAGIENLYYKLGYRHQAKGNANPGGHDERGYEITAGYTVPVSPHANVNALAEFADIQNFEAEPNDRRYITASLITTINEHWNLTASYTNRNIDTHGIEDTTDHLLQFSGGYDFGQGTTAEIGWRKTAESGVDTHIAGALIRHTFSF